MNGDVYVLWCEHVSASHYAPIRMDQGLRQPLLHLLFLSLFFFFSFVRGFNADQTGMTWRVGELFLKTLLSTIWVPCFCPSIRSALAAKHPARVPLGTRRFQLFKSCRVNTSRVIRSRGSQNDSGVKWDNSFSIVCWCRATEPGL